MGLLSLHAPGEGAAFASDPVHNVGRSGVKRGMADGAFERRDHATGDVLDHSSARWPKERETERASGSQRRFVRHGQALLDDDDSDRTPPSDGGKCRFFPPPDEVGVTRALLGEDRSLSGRAAYVPRHDVLSEDVDGRPHPSPTTSDAGSKRGVRPKLKLPSPTSSAPHTSDSRVAQLPVSHARHESSSPATFPPPPQPQPNRSAPFSATRVVSPGMADIPTSRQQSVGAYSGASPVVRQIETAGNTPSQSMNWSDAGGDDVGKATPVDANVGVSYLSVPHSPTSHTQPQLNRSSPSAAFTPPHSANDGILPPTQRIVVDDAVMSASSPVTQRGCHRPSNEGSSPGRHGHDRLFLVDRVLSHVPLPEVGTDGLTSDGAALVHFPKFSSASTGQDNIS